MLQTKQQNNPRIDPSAGEKARVNSGGADSRRAKTNNHRNHCAQQLCGVTNPPVTPPPRASACPPVNSQQEMGKDTHAKARDGGGPGGLRVGRPCCPNLTYTLERCKKQEIAGEKKRKRPPHQPKNHRENTGKMRQGAPTHPEERSATKAGEGKTRQGETHPPRENEENATRRKKKATKYHRNLWGSTLMA